MALKPEHFAFVSRMVRSEAAIVLGLGKEYLVESRLIPMARVLRYPDLESLLVAVIQSPPGSAIRAQVVDALTTNETLFFRDFHPFEALRTDVLPRLVRENAATRRLSIWSAAASTGQEAYSIAMLLRDSFPQLASWDIRILGTDISASSLETARAATYSQFEVNRGLPATHLLRYFAPLEGKWRLREELRRMVRFESMNLAQPWPALGPFDIVFMRNVLIYFDTATKQRLLQRLRDVLQPQGVLLLGTAETTFHLDPGWTPQVIGRTSVFRLPPSEGLPNAA
jgi:chemotaxis protein methyltransferase CheR